MAGVTVADGGVAGWSVACGVAGSETRWVGWARASATIFSRFCIMLRVASSAEAFGAAAGAEAAGAAVGALACGAAACGSCNARRVNADRGAAFGAGVALATATGFGASVVVDRLSAGLFELNL